MRTYPKSSQELKAQHDDVLHEDHSLYGSREELAAGAMQRYLAVLRANRRRREEYFTQPLRHFTEAVPIDVAVEARMIHQLRGRVIETSHPEESAIDVARAFPSGSFLFHGAKTSSLVEILRSGYLMNAHALGHKNDRTDNGGEEGVSWSLNDIEAIPSSRFHMAGFLAAPETVLGVRDQLAIPDAPAPFEVVQLSRNIDASKFYETYTQARLLELVYSGLAELDEMNSKNDEGVVLDYAEDEIQASYEIDDNDQIILDRSLASYVDKYGFQFAAKVWMKAETEIGTESDDAISSTIDRVVAHILKLSDELKDDISAKNDIRVPIDKLFFVVPDKDLDAWMHVLVRCGTKPAGIIAYDASTVRLEEFATQHKGDGGELAQQLRRVVISRDETLRYDEMLGKPLSDVVRSRYEPHVLSAAHLGNTRSVAFDGGQLRLQDK